MITVAFIGYLVGGPLGATLAALGVFLPCYLFVVIPALRWPIGAVVPMIPRWRAG